MGAVEVHNGIWMLFLECGKCPELPEKVFPRALVRSYGADDKCVRRQAYLGTTRILRKRIKKVRVNGMWDDARTRNARFPKLGLCKLRHGDVI